MTDSKGFVDNLFLTGQVLLSLAPIPGLSACAVVMQEVGTPA